MDTLTKQQRSERMSRIGGKDTKPEMLVRKCLHAAGYRFRLHVADLPGKPDIVLPKYKTVIFVHGCFWHGHTCHIGHVPKTNSSFWGLKIKSNSDRDTKRILQLLEQGWKVLIVWECAILGKSKLNTEKLLIKLEGFLKGSETQSAI